ncbi:MAG: hypothetical protein EZS28_034151, partial [Streblomastix strix]
FIIDYKGFDVVEEMNKLIINDKINVNIFYYDNDDKFYYLGERKQYNKIKHIKTDDNTEEQEEEPIDELLPTFNILLVSDTNDNQAIYHVFHVTNTDGLTRQKYCPHCYQQSFDPKDDHYKRDYEQHVSQCKINGGQIIKKVKLDEQPFPFIPHIQRNETYAYLLANNATQQFKPTHYYITYDFETVERKVNTYFGKPLTKTVGSGINAKDSVIRNSQWISVLEPLSVASTIKLKWREQYNNDDQYKKITSPFGTEALKTIYYDLRQGTDFITQWIEQVFEEAKQVALDNKHDDETIPYNQCVSIIGFNSSRFDQALFSKYLHNDKWTIQSFIGTMGQGKQIVVEHKQTKQQIKFIDAMNYTQPTDLASFAADFGNKDNESKGLFPYEGITFDNYNYELNKSQPFSIKAFGSQLKNKTMSDDDYQLYLTDAKNYATRWDYLQHYNELDTQIMIQPSITLEKGTKRKYTCKSKTDQKTKAINEQVNEQTIIEDLPIRLSNCVDSKLKEYNQQVIIGDSRLKEFNEQVIIGDSRLKEYNEQVNEQVIIGDLPIRLSNCVDSRLKDMEELIKNKMIDTI